MISEVDRSMSASNRPCLAKRSDDFSTVRSPVGIRKTWFISNWPWEGYRIDRALLILFVRYGDQINRNSNDSSINNQLQIFPIVIKRLTFFLVAQKPVEIITTTTTTYPSILMYMELYCFLIESNSVTGIILTPSIHFQKSC